MPSQVDQLRQVLPRLRQLPSDPAIEYAATVDVRQVRAVREVRDVRVTGSVATTTRSVEYVGDLTAHALQLFAVNPGALCVGNSVRGVGSLSEVRTFVPKSGSWNG